MQIQTQKMPINTTSPALHKSTRGQNYDNMPQNITKSIRASQLNRNIKEEKVSIQLQFMRLQQQYRKDIGNCQQEIQMLRDEVQRQNQKLRSAENRELLTKQEMTALHKENLKLYQENEKHKKLSQSLKTDNQALQLELQRWKSDRKTYSSKLDSIYEIKKNMNLQLMQKNSLIEDQQVKLRDNEKKLNEYKLKMEQMSTNLIEKQKQGRQMSYQIKSQLQTYFETNSVVQKLQYETRDLNDLNEGLRMRVGELEKDKQMLIQRIYHLGGQLSDRSQGENSGEEDHEQSSASFQKVNNPKHNRSTARQETAEYVLSHGDERLMLEIQSFMREFERVLDRKQEDKKLAAIHNEKVIGAIQCLQRHI